MWPKVRLAPWPLHYKSMKKNENASRSVCTHRNSPKLLEAWCFGTAKTTKVRFLANILLKGHQRSLEVANSFFSITLDWKEMECWDGFIVFVSWRFIDWYATSPISVIKWRWPDVISWPWPFKIKSYIVWSVSTRETRWYHCRCFSLISLRYS